MSLSIGRSNKIMGWEGVGNRQLLKCKLTANLKFINKKSFCYSILFLGCFTLKIESACSVMCQRKFKLYTVPNGLLFSTPTQTRFLFERMIDRSNFLSMENASSVR
jgi:predicted component of viral defense system (DUF524 family)